MLLNVELAFDVVNCRRTSIWEADLGKYSFSLSELEPFQSSGWKQVIMIIILNVPKQAYCICLLMNSLPYFLYFFLAITAWMMDLVSILPGKWIPGGWLTLALSTRSLLSTLLTEGGTGHVSELIALHDWLHLYAMGIMFLTWPHGLSIC